MKSGTQEKPTSLSTPTHLPGTGRARCRRPPRPVKLVLVTRPATAQSPQHPQKAKVRAKKCGRRTRPGASCSKRWIGPLAAADLRLARNDALLWEVGRQPTD